MTGLLVAGALIVGALIAGATAGGPAHGTTPHAVVFVYHGFADAAGPDAGSGLSGGDLDAHLAELADGPYTVRPLSAIIEAVKGGGALPDHTVALTVDDPTRAALTTAWPRLQRSGLPFTLFVATDLLDSGRPEYLDWDDVRTLARAGVDIGSMGADYTHLTRLTLDQTAAQIAKANSRFRAELGLEPALFAYPYGELTAALRDLVVEAGFRAAFGLHSGVMHPGSDFLYLPRFSLTASFADLPRFRLAANALPLPISDFSPSDPLLTQNPPALGFTVDPSAGPIDGLACYASGQGATALEQLGARRVEVRIALPFEPGRARLNCTLPGPDGRWRWFGTQFVVPPAP